MADDLKHIPILCIDVQGFTRFIFRLCNRLCTGVVWNDVRQPGLCRRERPPNAVVSI